MLPQAIRQALVIPLIVVVLVVPARLLTVVYAEATLNRGAEMQHVLRDLQYQRARLSLLQIDQESGVRGYIITGDPRFLAPYYNAEAAWDGAVTALRADVSLAHLPAAHLDTLIVLHERWIAEVARPTLQNPHRDVILLQQRGQAIMDAFKRAQVAFRKDTVAAAGTEDRKLQQSIAETLLVGALVSLIFIAAALVLAFRQVRSAQDLLRIEALYLNEKRTADALQEAFQQKQLPQVSGVALNATYVPAASSARVGGDWYDAFELPSGRVLFSIGDVAGHGIEAAVVMTRARQAILAAALAENDPALVLERANSTILLQEGIMVTAICGFIDPHSFEITYATAGHPAPILARHASGPEMLSAQGLPLGIFPDSKYTRFHAQAAVADVLILYTDGVIEYDRDALSGTARLIDAAAKTAASPEPAVALYDAIFGTNAPADDVAILTATFREALA
jgi:serine phosphatase RsbU (regulator of sigma subunit)